MSRKMEKAIVAISAIVAIIVGIVAMLVANPTMFGAEYMMLCKVISVDAEYEVVAESLHDGHLWVFVADDEWHTGDLCQLLMNDCRTPGNIFDDEIEEVYTVEHFHG